MTSRTTSTSRQTTTATTLDHSGDGRKYCGDGVVVGSDEISSTEETSPGSRGGKPDEVGTPPDVEFAVDSDDRTCNTDVVVLLLSLTFTAHQVTGADDALFICISRDVVVLSLRPMAACVADDVSRRGGVIVDVACTS